MPVDINIGCFIEKNHMKFYLLTIIETMEEPTGDNNSDSDSIDSWTILDKKANEPNDAEISEKSDNSRGNTQITETKVEEDTDTDGVSIISDEEADAATIKMEDDNSICYRNEKIDIPIHDNPIQNENNLKQPYPPHYTKEFMNDLDSVSTATIRGSEDELCDEYFTNSKVRSYIHKRNNKLSAVLNMVLIGTIITTACLAIGHMWGTTDDCSPDMFSSLSQLVYNMQELQHENYILKSKLKVLESKNPRPNQIPLSLYQTESYRKSSQNFVDLTAKEQTEEFLKQEKTSCQCINDDNVDIFPKNVTDSINFKESEIPKLNGTIDEFSNKIEIDETPNLNSMLNDDYIPQPYARRKLSKRDISKKVYKRAIPKGYHNMINMGPKTYDVYMHDNSGEKYKNKNAYYLKNNASHLNKKYAKKEKKKNEKYLKETSLNYKNIENEKFRKGPNKKFKNANMESLKIDESKNLKHPEPAKKHIGNDNNKDVKKEKYKIKDYKLKKEQNYQYKEYEPKKDLYKDETYNRDKKGKRLLQV
ncbi:uncharacterized protein LOC143910774 [Arctopsyche grandis]|uniref:uncharacterized protein LOC143910774 n=1 Tax=Arctopsyche grandis TaxID=121162 RepID=UPI00406D86FA